MRTRGILVLNAAANNWCQRKARTLRSDSLWLGLGLLILVGLCPGCEQAPPQPLKSDIASEEPDGDRQASPAPAETRQPVVTEVLPGPDPVASSIVGEPIHRYAAKSVAFSPDGNWLAIGYGSGRVRLWDVGEETIARQWAAHNKWAFDLWFSKDSQSLWTGGGDNRVRRWDIETGEVRDEFADHTDDVHGIAVTDDGGQLVSGGDDRLVVVRDLSTGEVRTLEGHSEQVTAIALNVEETLIASAGRDDSARLWEIESGKLRNELTGHEDDVLCVDFSDDGRRLLTGSNDGTARIWDVETGKLLQTFDGHDGAVFTAVWLPGGKLIATGSADRKLRLIRIDDGQTLATQYPQANVADIAVSPAGDVLAVATSGGNVHLFETDGSTLQQSLVIPPIAPAVKPAVDPPVER